MYNQAVKEIIIIKKKNSWLLNVFKKINLSYGDRPDLPSLLGSQLTRTGRSLWDVLARFNFVHCKLTRALVVYHSTSVPNRFCLH